MLKGSVQLGAGSRWESTFSCGHSYQHTEVLLRHKAANITLFYQNLKPKELFHFYGERVVDLTLETSIAAEERTLCF